VRNERPGELLGDSIVLRELQEEINHVARSDAKVLITGESGSGKELVAVAVHARSPRATKPFVAVNCAGVPETLLESELFGHVKGSFTGAYRDRPGKLEQAHHGTIFLDEIGEMTLRMQGLLLRFLETGELQKVGADGSTRHVNVRVIAATNRDLRELVTRGVFREDLFYRLNVVPIHIPPLRARREDIPLLVAHFVDRIGAEHGRGRRVVTPEAMKLLSEYSWPGNIRELKNLIERLLIMTDRDSIGPDDVEDALPPDTGEGPPSEIKAARDKAERDAIHGMLRECQWNVSEAARRLGMDRGYLHRKIKRYGLARDGGA
jgi:two-component system nitrogen regulation response regulator NtrX